MTAPNLFPASFSANGTNPATAYALAPVLRDGGPQAIQSSVSVAAATASGTLIGLVPFRAGARVLYSSRVYTPDLDTGSNVTFAVGYIYDDNVTYSNSTAAFSAAVTTPQAGGFITFTAQTGFQFIAAADGWVTALIGGGPTTTTGTVQSEIIVQYDVTPVYS